eukprot:4247488-Amphidinium_carterae.1
MAALQIRELFVWNGSFANQTPPRTLVVSPRVKVIDKLVSLERNWQGMWCCFLNEKGNRSEAQLCSLRAEGSHAWIWQSTSALANCAATLSSSSRSSFAHLALVSYAQNTVDCD